jgi:hypothetical protein
VHALAHLPSLASWSGGDNSLRSARSRLPSSNYSHQGICDYKDDAMPLRPKNGLLRDPMGAKSQNFRFATAKAARETRYQPVG